MFFVWEFKMRNYVISVSHSEAQRMFNQAFNIWANFEQNQLVDDAIHEIQSIFFDGDFCFHKTYVELLVGLGHEQIRSTETRESILYAGFYLEVSAIFCQILEQIEVSKEAQQRLKNVIARIFENYPEKNCEPPEPQGMGAWGRRYLEHYQQIYYETHEYEFR